MISIIYSDKKSYNYIYNKLLQLYIINYYNCGYIYLYIIIIVIVYYDLIIF